MKPNWEHPVTTDQKFRNDDEHLRELDKKHLKESEKESEFIPKPAKKPDAED